MLAYGSKGLPHALVHTSELVERGGHHLAYDTSVGESGHKHFIKTAATFARTYSSHNTSERAMLGYVQKDTLWSATIKLNQFQHTFHVDSSTSPDPLEDDPLLSRERNNLGNPLSYGDSWSAWSPEQPPARTPRVWGATFLSKHVLVTRDELLTLLRQKLQMSPTLANNVRLCTKLHWEFYGTYRVFVRASRSHRTFVGHSSFHRGRRDFVRPSGYDGGHTCYLCQVSNIYVSY